MAMTAAELLEQVRSLRSKAAQARRLAGVVGTEADRFTLLEYADSLDRQAGAMDAAGAAESPPVAVHQTPVQMAQAQLTALKDDEQDQAPTNSN
jgi:hypothetical protein